MTAATTTRLVTFRVGSELFAVDISSVERVLRYEAARAVPSFPAWIEGVLEHGGRVVPVIDLRRRFGMDAPVPGPQARLLILTLGAEWVGAVVDRVLDIRAVASDDITPPPAIVRGIAGEYLRGVVRRDDSLVVVLDVDRILGGMERLELATAGAALDGVGKDA